MRSFFRQINKRKFKMFLVFLAASSLAWTISQLSETYEARVVFPLRMQHLPDSLLLDAEVTPMLSTKLRSSGFQFLRYALWSKTLVVDVQKVKEVDGNFYLTDEQLKPQLERQLPNNVSLLPLDQRRYMLNLYKVMVKRVPVKPRLELQLAPNYILREKLSLRPDSVTIKGPVAELSGIQSIETEPSKLENVTANFSKNVQLVAPEGFVKSELLEATTEISGIVESFSEKEFELRIIPLEVPEGYRARIFPSTVKLICKASMDRLKVLSSGDFKVVVNLGAMQAGSNILPLHLAKSPKEVYSVRLLHDNVEFVLEKL